MQPLESTELLFGLLFVSFFASICFLIAGGFTLLLIGSMSKLSRKYPNRSDFKILIRRGYYIALWCLGFAFFFAARIILAVQYNQDVAPNHGLIFDGVVSVVVFMLAAYVFSVFNALKPDE